MTEPTFEQSITDYENGLIEALWGLIDGQPELFSLEASPAQRAIGKFLDDHEQAIHDICAIARDYARRPEGE